MRILYFGNDMAKHGKTPTGINFLGDANWALSMREYHAGNPDAGYLFGSGVAAALPWVLGTVGGHIVGHSVPNPSTLGLDFMLVGFAAAIGWSVFRGRGDLWPVAAAVIAAFALVRWLPGWTVVGAGLAAGLVGALRHEH